VFITIQGAPIGQLGAPFILKDVISIYNYNFFSPKTLELDVYWINSSKITDLGLFRMSLGSLWLYKGPQQAS
jgi:hypothetical protein